MKKIAVVGCGNRSDAYMHSLASGKNKEWMLLGLADPNSAAIETYQKFYGSDATLVFSSGPEMLEKLGRELDGIIIGSPNLFHKESLLPSMENNLAILLEKPVAISIQDCREMWKAYLNNGCPNVAVGFVLRYTSFYKKIMSIIDSGILGQVLSITATESIVPAITSLFLRNWRSDINISGPFIVEKCCHDFDILNMISKSRARKVTSFAAKSRFLPNKDMSVQCRECKNSETCRYNIKRINKMLVNCSPNIEIGKVQMKENDLCVFNNEKDIPDHQIVNIEYENGVLATFNVILDQPTPTRTISIFGTLGQVMGNIEEDDITIYLHGTQHEENSFYSKPFQEKIIINHDQSGHHGGDSIITNCFKEMLSGTGEKPLVGLKEGIDACLVALAAEKSRNEGIVVNMNELFKSVYDE